MSAVAITEHVLERDGCPLHYWLAGPDDRPLLVFTHGATVDHHMFDAQLPDVVADYRVLTWDVRGHGRSQPLGSGFGIGQAVDDLLAIVDRLGYAQATFIGQSMGTYIGQELVFQRPDRVRALVVVGGTCITLNKLAPLEAMSLRLSPLLFRLYSYERLRHAFARAVSVQPHVRRYVYEAAGQIAKPDFLTIWTGVVQCLHYEAGYRIEQPLLLAHGEHDRTGNIRRIAPRWAARDPHCRYVVIPNAGHTANQDAPEFFNSLLLDYLRACVAV